MASDKHACRWVTGGMMGGQEMKGCLVPLGISLADQLKHNDVVTIKVQHERRLRHHNFYFKCIGILYSGWPDDHPFQPQTAEMLRKYLQCRAGWGDTTVCEDIDALCAVFATAYGKDPIVETAGGKFFVHIPRSVKFSRMDQAEFHEMMDAIDEILYDECGYGFAELKLSMLEVDHGTE